MDEVDYRGVVETILDQLIDGLSPFIAEALAMHVSGNQEWPELLRRADAANGIRGGEYRTGDLSLMLRALTERLGSAGYPFSRRMSRQAQIYASELREVRGQWARDEPFTSAQAVRAADSAELLLRAIGAHTQAEAVAGAKPALPPADRGAASKPDAVRDTPVTPPADTVRTNSTPHIEITAVTDLSYAMAHCRIPVVENITIHNSGEDVHGAVVEVDVVSAHGSFGGAREVHVDLAAHKPTILRDVDLKLDPEAMLEVSDQRPGLIRVALRAPEGQLLAEGARDVDILAANQWKATPPQLALELLAAYVQPNSPVISQLIVQVSDRLLKTTGNSAVDGYQSENPERVDAIARAVFDAMRARDIRYAEPPASWGDHGQKVRTPAEVLEGRLGTCLDTTLVMAAALEHAGINSTIWMLKGHAFLGYWRTDSALSMVSTTEVVDVVNQVDLGNIGLVETTMTTQSAAAATFDAALSAPRVRHLHGNDLTDIIGVTDIRQAREAHIYPLPSRTTDQNGNVVVAVYQPGAGRAIGPYVAIPGRQRSSDDDPIPARVSQWKNALLDLSLRNKLINYTDRAGYRIDVPGPQLGRLEDAVNAGAPITLVPSDDIKSVDAARGIRYGRDLPESDRELLLADKHSAYVDITQAAYQSKLRYLANKAKTIVEETGANNLYLAFGMLHWRFNDRDLQSPLVLVPVTLSTKNRGERYVLTLDEAGTSTPNFCLLEKLRVALNLQIPGLANPVEDESGIDLGAAFEAVRRAIADAGLHFRVEDTVHLSILQFAKFPLWKDLDESWKELSHNSLVTHLIHTPHAPFDDPVVATADVTLDELSVSVPVPADSSQLRAVADAVAGKTFVLEGPPGTGKSQTITNLLAHAMASGCRVLFVAEKRAALDVVKKRLEAVGLGELSLDLHDKSARPSTVRAQIREALELRVGHDEELLRTNMQVAESSRRNLARYAQRLHEKNAVQQSLYNARTRALAADQHVEPLEVPKELVAGVSRDVFEMLGQMMRSLPEYADAARPRRDHPWGFIDNPPQSGLNPSQIHSAAVSFDSALDEIQRGGLALDAIARAETPTLIAQWGHVGREPRFPLDGVDSLQTEARRAEIAAIEHLLASIATSAADWLAAVSPAAMDADIPAVHEQAVAADQSGFFGRKKRRRAVLMQLTDVLTVDPDAVALKTLSQLTGQILATHAMVADVRARVAHLPVTVFNRPWNPLVAADAAHLQLIIASWRRLGETLSERTGEPYVVALRTFYSGTRQGHLAEPLERMASAWQQLGELTGSTPQQQRTWAGEGSFVEGWWTTRSARRLETASSIEHWVNLISHLEPLRAVGMGIARAAILKGQIDANDAALAFDRGLAQASIAERLQASDLVEFDTAAHAKTIDRFTTSAAAIRGELRHSIPATLLARRRFNADAMNGQVGGLRRQLDRKRGGMGVRALMENYGELITQILPCTLMSPDSVARFFPAKRDLFDIVVFDEASQIRVADAVGAMGRAKSVVVVGDSKQMPPTSFAETSAAIDDDDDYNPDVVLDEESILTECVHALVPQQWLSWHYRSQDEALIAFSNFHYYSGTLASFPAPLPAFGDHGISLVRVNGHFERSGRGKTLRTNRVEAEAIVADILRRFDDSTDAPSLGVITFNAQQRDLIENMLRDTREDRLLQALDATDGLFVKNLENVQGDERDTILFSVAFSKNDKGVVPLNFGPLSRPGGERRLNVAVTRARREVVLYASFDPSELRAEETFQIGTKHLKAYLEMAARGVEAITEGGRRQSVIDRHRDDVADALRREGFTISTDVGLSDFRVDIVIADPEDPDQPLVAVLLDGEEWFSRKTVADRDGLPVDVLENLMHWPAVERVWLPEWLNRREETIARLGDAVARAKDRPVADEGKSVLALPTVVPPPNRASDEWIPVARSAPTVTREHVKARQHPAVTQFREWTSRTAGDVSVLDQLPAPSAKTRVQIVAQAVIEAEAPVHRDRLAKLVAGAFGLNRVSDDRRRAIHRVVPAAHRRENGEDFFWPADVDPDTWRAVRRPEPGVSRPLEEVSLVEIANAMMVVAEELGGAEKPELKREALAMFGGKRMTPAINARLDAALQQALAKGKLRQTDSGHVFIA
ncbi:DNA helicase [Mycobacterium sp. Soil538]|nr:DNA helicase [Mycobacterium sp. Soil538]